MTWRLKAVRPGLSSRPKEFLQVKIPQQGACENVIQKKRRERPENQLQIRNSRIWRDHRKVHKQKHALSNVESQHLELQQVKTAGDLAFDLHLSVFNTLGVQGPSNKEGWMNKAKMLTNLFWVWGSGFHTFVRLFTAWSLGLHMFTNLFGAWGVNLSRLRLEGTLGPNPNGNRLGSL